MPRIKDLTGRKFGHLTVLRQAPSDLQLSGKTDTLWFCQCDCGNEELVVRSRGSLQSAKTPSCGCGFKGMNGRHNMTNSHLYRVWCHMKSRCLNPNVERYPQYGGRGITICEDWVNSFDKFMEWAFQHGYQEDLSLERRDVNGNYSPENCCWIPLAEQQKNRTCTVYMEVRGEKLRIQEIADKYGFTYSCIKRRIQKGDRGEDLIRPLGTRIPHKEVVNNASL